MLSWQFMMRLTPALGAIPDLLYPPACLLCHARCVRDAVVCGACQQACRRPSSPMCSRCGLPLQGAFDAQMLCRACRDGRLGFEAARAAWLYAGPIQEAIQQFKYLQQWRLGRWLAAEMTNLARRELPLADIDAVLGVPMHWLKRRVRGEDSSAFLAQCVSQDLEKPCAQMALTKTRWTRTQTSLRGPHRFRNVRSAYRSPAQIPGARLLLVDDVLTSGATADACAGALKEAGAAAVYVLTAARTPLDG